MAATNYSPIQLYYSTTASAAPAAGNLVSGELAINITDGKLYYKDNAGTVQLLSTSTTANGTANGVLYLNGSKVATSGSALTFNGTSLGVGSSSYGDAGTITASIGVAGTTAGGLQLWASSAQEHYIQWGDSTSGSATYAGAISYSHASDFMRFWVNSSEQMRLTSTGLGIGTSSPGAKLAVSNGTQTGIINPRSSAAGGLAIGTDVASTGYVLNLAGDLNGGGTGGGVNIAYYSSASGTWNAALQIRNTASTYSNLLLMPDGGNLGIGTSSPAQKLHVVGAAGYLTNFQESSANKTRFQVYVDTSEVALISGYDTTAKPMTFYTGGAKVATLDSSGNLGLGVTPSAWGSNYKALQMPGGIYGGGSFLTDNGSPAVSANAYNNGSGWKYVNNDYATIYQSRVGQHQWYTAASGTAGDPITFTQAMTLDASGNLGIGTTSPSSYQLGGKFAVASSTSGFYFNDANNRLILDGAGTARDLIFYFRYSNTATIASDSNLIFQTGSSPAERARITSAGNFGVGTTSPYSAIGVAGDITLGLSPGPGGSYGKYSWRYGNSASFGAAGYIDVIQVANGNSGSMIFATNNNTPDTAEPTERMRITSGGVLLVGASSSDLTGSVKASVVGNFAVQNGGTTGTYLQVVPGAANGTVDLKFDARSGNYPAATFWTGNTERARIDSSGNLLVGTTSAISAGKYSSSFAGATENGIILQTTLASTGSTFIGFVNSSGSIIGSVTQNGASTVAYNTSSDYRLKNVIGNVTGSGARIDALEPIEYEWKASGERTRGFLAHKFQEVYPQSVTGTKDAVDADGNPVYQAMQASTSEVIADLVAEIQSLRKRLADAGIA